MLLLHTYKESDMKMPILETIWINAVGFVFSEPEQLGEIQMCENIWSVYQVLKWQQRKTDATDC